MKNWHQILLVLVVAVAAGLVCMAKAQTPSPPQVIPQFYDPAFQGNFAGAGGIASQFWYDKIYGGWKYNYNESLLGIPIYESVVQPPSPATFYIANDVCRIVKYSNFSDFFVWLPFATYGGQVVIDNRTCDEWYFTYSKGTLVYDGLSSNASIPVRLVFPYESIVSTETINATMLWSDQLVPGPFPNPEEVFSVPESCYNDGHLCDVPKEEQAVPLTAYIFHEANDFSLVNTNIADLEGDTVFVCGALLSDGFPYFSLISSWELVVNSSYGQYALCNFGNCIGGNPYAVGHEAAGGLGASGGQCSEYPNNITGNWFSLQNTSMCAPGQVIGDNGCTWQIIGRTKTINSTCLLNHSFADACEEDFASLSFPLVHANKLFLQAFESEIESENGCPALPGPEIVLGLSDIEAAIAASHRQSFDFRRKSLEFFAPPTLEELKKELN